MEYTRFKNGIEADEIKAAEIKSNAFTGVSKAYTRITKVSTDGNYEIPIANRSGVVAISITASSKTVTANMPNETSCIVVNIGANTFTLKNGTEVTGLSLPTGCAALVIGLSSGPKIIPLYTPAT